MALTNFEKCAGKWWRDVKAEPFRLARADGCAPCSPRVAFYRHECAEQEGRTRSIALGQEGFRSPEIWVTWSGDDLKVIGRDEAEELVAKGEPVEFEVILAGKFSYDWKTGECPRCHLKVISEGVFKDARPLPAARQDDLASFSQGQLLRTTPGLLREHQ
jgi:hypothetical protein